MYKQSQIDVRVGESLENGLIVTVFIQTPVVPRVLNTGNCFLFR